MREATYFAGQKKSHRCGTWAQCDADLTSNTVGIFFSQNGIYLPRLSVLGYSWRPSGSGGGGMKHSQWSSDRSLQGICSSSVFSASCQGPLSWGLSLDSAAGNYWQGAATMFQIVPRSACVKRDWEKANFTISHKYNHSLLQHRSVNSRSWIVLRFLEFSIMATGKIIVSFPFPNVIKQAINISMCAVDFGTTYSGVAYAYQEDGETVGFLSGSNRIPRINGRSLKTLISYW